MTVTGPTFYTIAGRRSQSTGGTVWPVPTLVFHPIPLVAPIVAAVWYTTRRRAVEPWRAGCFLAAVAVFVAATLPYAPRGFVLQSLQAMFLLLVVPPLLLLSRGKVPALPTPARSAAVTRFVTHPVAVWAVVGSAVIALYWSGQYRAAVEHPAVWQLTQLELVAAGCLFAWPAVASAHRPAIGWRLAHVLFGILYWSVVGMALESQHTGIAPGIGPAALHAGAGDMWTAAVLLTIAGSIGLVFEWLFADLDRARHADRVNADEDAHQLAAWRAVRREAALADVRASESVEVRSRPAGTDRSERSFSSARRAAPDGTGDGG